MARSRCITHSRTVVRTTVQRCRSRSERFWDSQRLIVFVSRGATPSWNSGLTTQLQGGALNIAADKLRKDLLQRAADVLKIDAAKLQVKDGVISSSEDPKKRITFADLVRANKGPIRQ